MDEGSGECISPDKYVAAVAAETITTPAASSKVRAAPTRATDLDPMLSL